MILSLICSKKDWISTIKRIHKKKQPCTFSPLTYFHHSALWAAFVQKNYRMKSTVSSPLLTGKKDKYSFSPKKTATSLTSLFSKLSAAIVNVMLVFLLLRPC